MTIDIDIVGLRNLADNLRPEYPVTMEELDKMLDLVTLDNEPDSVPQPDQVLGNASRTLTLMDQRIDAVRKQLAELEEQRDAFVRDLRKLGGGG